jgi:hypothetical protein
VLLGLVDRAEAVGLQAWRRAAEEAEHSGGDSESRPT